MMDREQLMQEGFLLLARLMAWADPSRLEEWAELGLTITQIRILFMLRWLPGPSARQLAQELEVSPSTLTRIMDRLERHGLVRRVTDRQDRRQVRHLLTPKGREMVARLERTGRARLGGLMSRLSSDELEQVVEALRILHRSIAREEGTEAVKP